MRKSILVVLVLALAGLGTSCDWWKGSPTPIEIAYDDGEAEGGRGKAMAWNGYAVRFTPPIDRVTLLQARYYIRGFRAGPASIELHVWDADRNDLIEPFEETPTEQGWFEVDLSPNNLVIAGDFYIGYLQTTADAYPWIGFDTTDPDGRSYNVPGWSLVTTLGEPEGDFLIRAVVVAAD